MRNRKTSSSTAITPTAYSAQGHLVREYGRKMGWDLGLCNVMVEGSQDVEYFRIANELYRRTSGRTLIDSDFRVFAAGDGTAGGTSAINEKLNVLAALLKVDPVDEDGNQLRIVALFDDDPAGRGVFNKMKNKYRPWGDIFLLRRRFPRNTRDPNTFAKTTQSINASYLADKNFYCEIEDLLDRSLIELFIEENAGCLQREMQTVDDGFHCEFDLSAKSRLVRYVDKHAGLAEVEQIVDVLKTLRFLFSLDEQGTEVE